MLYASMISLLANVNLKSETRPLVNYVEATYNIIGFDKQGKIFYGV